MLKVQLQRKSDGSLVEYYMSKFEKTYLITGVDFHSGWTLRGGTAPTNFFRETPEKNVIVRTCLSPRSRQPPLQSTCYQLILPF